VIVTVTGKTVEIVDTDAEGRLLLADTLALASRKASLQPNQEKDSKVTSIVGSTTNELPGIIIDFATLTGACVTALTNRYMGAFTNRPEYISKLIEAGQQSGERIWPFPSDTDFLEDLERTDIADLSQCRVGGDGDHIYAAVFLQQFLPENVPWVHVDMSSAHREEGALGHISSEYTGVGPRFAIEFLRKINKINF
jgi:leucyl aminopeptidase